MSTNPNPNPGTIIEFSSATDNALVPQLLQIHMSCVLADHMLARFLPPFGAEKRARMAAFYDERIAAVDAGTQHLFLCVEGEGEGAGAGAGAGDGRRVMGMAFLSKPWAETGPFRASVELLMVGPGFRRRGVARRLIERVERKAVEVRRTLLCLDTEEGSDAESIYPRLGYTEVGRIPDYGYSPKDHSLKAGVFFYKSLQKPEAEPYAPM